MILFYMTQYCPRVPWRQSAWARHEIASYFSASLGSCVHDPIRHLAQPLLSTGHQARWGRPPAFLNDPCISTKRVFRKRVFQQMFFHFL